MRINEFGKRPENGPAAIESDSGEKGKKIEGGELNTSSRVSGFEYLKERNAEVSKSNYETDPHNTERTPEEETKPEGNSPLDET